MANQVNDGEMGRERARRCCYMRLDGYSYRFIAKVFRCKGPDEAKKFVAMGRRLIGAAQPRLVGSADEVAAEIGRSDLGMLKWITKMGGPTFGQKQKPVSPKTMAKVDAAMTLIEKAKRLRKGE